MALRDRALPFYYNNWAKIQLLNGRMELRDRALPFFYNNSAKIQLLSRQPAESYRLVKRWKLDEKICASGVPAGKWGILLDPSLRFNTCLIFNK